VPTENTRLPQRNGGGGLGFIAAVRRFTFAELRCGAAGKSRVRGGFEEPRLHGPGAADERQSSGAAPNS